MTKKVTINELSQRVSELQSHVENISRIMSDLQVRIIELTRDYRTYDAFVPVEIPSPPAPQPQPQPQRKTSQRPSADTLKITSPFENVLQLTAKRVIENMDAGDVFNEKIIPQNVGDGVTDYRVYLPTAQHQLFKKCAKHHEYSLSSAVIALAKAVDGKLKKGR